MKQGSEKYYLFSGSDYYPAGGIDDLVGVFRSVEEAKAAFIAGKKSGSPWRDWAHIADADLRKVSLFISISYDDSIGGPREFWEDK